MTSPTRRRTSLEYYNGCLLRPMLQAYKPATHSKVTLSKKIFSLQGNIITDKARFRVMTPSRSMLRLQCASTARPRRTVNVGTVGVDSVMEQLLSMMMTDAIPGRSSGSSWMNSSPTWMHLSTSCDCRPSARHPSSSFLTLPRLQCLQTCPGQDMMFNIHS